ncbi:PREDICTED: LOW QUALITY PROTEIN: uncharacterized protein At4g15970-like [Brassica oleracea var. oleracea]|nr:PREDICTED: LOW QUALITY PROTEIN: uncharacterized protein At4g15970-like [Brassica oleracea var. oleracea]
MAKDVGALQRVLLEASTEEKTVILTTLYQAWAEPNSTFDLFLEGFHVGVGTKRLLRHLVVVCMDEEAYSRCLEIHPRRCYLLKTPGIDFFSGQKNFMTPDYLKMMWRRLEFLGSILELGYNFLFTSMDILWLRDPFPHLFSGVDFQVTCDHSNGNTSDPGNVVNGGFKFVQANHRTVKFYKYWYELRWTFCGKNEQDVFNIIKHDRFVTEELGLTMRFLDTVYFRGFCQLHREMDKICIMHANCCLGLHNKINGLRQSLKDWKDYLSATDRRNMTWPSPDRCRGSMSNISLIV